MLTTLGVLITLTFTGLLLLAERRESQSGKWLTKPLAATGFIVTALGQGALLSHFGQILFLAFALCWLGDILLISNSEKAFLAGLVSFLAGHIAFTVAFVVRGVDVTWAVASLVPTAIVSLAIGRWLLPHVDRPMRGPVAFYMLAITCMVAAAVGTFGAHGVALIVVGAIAFYASDISVARDRFVAPGFDNRAWGLPLYFVAQLIFAFSIGAS